MMVVGATLFLLAGGSCKSSVGDGTGGTGGQSGGAATSPDGGGGAGTLAVDDGSQPTDGPGSGAAAADVPAATDAVGGAGTCPQVNPGGMTCEKEDDVCSTTGPEGRLRCTCRLNGFGLMLWACEADGDAG
jgi:hypothetical protein